MSFPASFGSQLSAIMEALLKAVVAEVTALVEDGAVELRLELRDRERQILEKERDVQERDRVIEARDRVIEELRAAVEELTAREEAAASPAEERPEQTESCVWTKEEKETKPIVKSEPTEEFTASSSEPHVSLWPPPPLSTITSTADTAVACSFDANHETAQSYSQYSQETEDFSNIDQADLLAEQFYSTTQPGFSLMPNLCQVQDNVHNKNIKKKSLNTKRWNYGTFRCDQCGKTFTAKCRLITHQSVHTGVKLFSCRKCGKRFTRRDNCVRHEKSDPRCKDTLGK